MNQYTQLLYYIKELAENDAYINTITKSEDDSIDLDKGNIFPLFNIDINDATFTSISTVSFSVQIQCLALRDINKEVVEDKFWRQDNEVDNHNETLASLSRIWQIMNRDFTENNITASDNPTLTKITFSNKNLLDGWEMDFDVEMPNDNLNLCNSLELC